MTDHRFHVLVVEDNSELLGIYTEILEQAGYRVTACTSGLVSMIRIGIDRPDVVLLDIKLDDVSGLEMFRAIKIVNETADLPIVFISGIYLDEEMVREQAGDSMVQLLLKPIPTEALISGIETALSRDRRAA